MDFKSVILIGKYRETSIFASMSYGIITPYLSVFSRNAGKYVPEKLGIGTFFTQCFLTKVDMYRKTEVDVYRKLSK